MTEGNPKGKFQAIWVLPERAFLPAEARLVARGRPPAPQAHEYLHELRSDREMGAPRPLAARPRISDADRPPRFPIYASSLRAYLAAAREGGPWPAPLPSLSPTEARAYVRVMTPSSKDISTLPRTAETSRLASSERPASDDDVLAILREFTFGKSHTPSTGATAAVKAGVTAAVSTGSASERSSS